MGGLLRFGLVGAGAIGQTYAWALEKSDRASLAAVADIREEAARALAEGHNAKVYTDHLSLADQADCDAVIVCTPPATHTQVCVDLLERRLPVLCEKPLSIDTEGALKMVAAASRNETILTMASKFRYVEDVIRAKSIVTSGILGEIILFENAFTSRVDMAGRWNADPAISGGGVLIDNGTHSVDIVRYFLGPIADVQAVEGKRVQAVAVEDTVRLFIRTAGGVTGTVDLSWTINKELDSYIDIYGSHGVVRVGWRESRYRQMGNQDWVVFGSGYNKLDAVLRQINNFCGSILGRESLLIRADDALASVEVIETAYRSLLQNRWVEVGNRNRGG
jgi:predicted dehydrogenase